MDRITLTGITALGRHGVFDHERENGQPFSADVTLSLDLTAAGASDQLADTVDYARVATAVHAQLVGEPLNTIEALAHRVADVCLRDPRVREAEVTIHKPMAAVSVLLSDVSVTITRSAS